MKIVMHELLQSIIFEPMVEVYDRTKSKALALRYIDLRYPSESQHHGNQPDAKKKAISSHVDDRYCKGLASNQRWCSKAGSSIYQGRTKGLCGDERVGTGGSALR